MISFFLLIFFEDINDWEESSSVILEKSNYYGFMNAMGILNCKQVTPSYRELPEEIKRPSCAGKTALGDEVLNESVVCLPVGTEGGDDDQGKHYHKNQYEDALFRVEDERFEVLHSMQESANSLFFRWTD